MSVVDVSPDPDDDSEPSSSTEPVPSPDYLGNMVISGILTLAAHVAGTAFGIVDPTPATISFVFLTGLLALGVVDMARLLMWHVGDERGWL